jgi:hypothetical protein
MMLLSRTPWRDRPVTGHSFDMLIQGDTSGKILPDQGINAAGWLVSSTKIAPTPHHMVWD